MAVTARDVVTQALVKAGITGRGIAPRALDINDGLTDLNDMIGQWRTQRIMMWSLLSTGFVGDGRTTPYTVGPGGEYNMTPRPNRIEAAFVRQLQNVGSLYVDTPLKVIDAREEYSRISTKTLASFPMAVFLDTTATLAQLYVYPWPKPAGQYAVFIVTKNTMPVLTINTDVSTLPDGYIPAMKFNLARRLRQSYGRGLKPDPELNKLARESLDVVKQANLQLPEMVMPVSLTRQGSGYNIYSDQFGN